MQHLMPARPAAPAPAPALPVHGGARLARGWAGAVLAVVLAAASHTVLGAAHAPHPMVLLLAVALAAPVCTLLAGRRLSLPRVLAAVLGSQAILHGLYSLASPAPEASAAFPTTAGHLGHAVPASGELASFAAAHSSAHTAAHGGAGGHDHLGLGMLAAHVVAALLTVLLIRHGERLLVRAAGLVVGAVLRRRVPALRPAVGRVRLLWGTSAPLVPAGRELVGSTGLRGPPAALVAA
ncbi:hypothetical protein FM125_11475 [Micrococcus lylae]|uniref:Uncharacterized protein n=1 Tax=Micrococcus lylae TaxID=1273 RepID=A0A1R4JZC0_9MICC|nr:hypothetical protein [Micrococcus lylae]SJN37254.1 hypothetical protein FM125_11475 [Micrococcus lylae]